MKKVLQQAERTDYVGAVEQQVEDIAEEHHKAAAAAAVRKGAAEWKGHTGECFVGTGEDTELDVHAVDAAAESEGSELGRAGMEPG